MLKRSAFLGVRTLLTGGVLAAAGASLFSPILASGSEDGAANADIRVAEGMLVKDAASLTAQDDDSDDRNRGKRDRRGQQSDGPNVILIMADDLGWGDVGYNGNTIVRTPHLDQMAAEGLNLERFYTASPICSPTRASVLIGRHPYRAGIWAAHTAGMRVGETTVAELAGNAGYNTGFFGKWHLGWLDPDPFEAADDKGFYSPPGLHGFDTYFATQSAVPTWDPGVTPFDIFGNKEGEPWKGGKPYVLDGEVYQGDISGDDSRIIMDKVLPFIDKGTASGKPFLATVWFHTPHEPVVAGPEYLAMYADLPSEKQRHYFGAITAMDEQIGRLRAHLTKLGIAEDTLIFFTSDNGPSGPSVRQAGASAGPFRGRKHDVYEGGVRVPSLAVWPGRIKPSSSDALLGTVDYLPSILEVAGIAMPRRLGPTLDGISFAPLFAGKPMKTGERTIATGYRRLFRGEDGLALVRDRYKLVRDKKTGDLELYDLTKDPAEKDNIAAQNVKIVTQMAADMRAFELSTTLSSQGADYNY